MNILGSTILTGMSIVPVLFVYAIMGLLEGCYLVALIIGLVGFLAFALGMLLLRYAKVRLEKHDFDFTSAEVADRESIGLLVLYVLPLLRVPFPDIGITILIPTAVIFMALVLTGHSYHFNPLLNLFGWHFYKMGTPEGVTYILITKKTITDATKGVTTTRLTTHTLLDAN